MTDQLVNVYAAEIVKSAREEDGTLFVVGVATDSATDNDGQVCDPTWLKSAMPEWFRWGNIREQHSKIAAGVATELEESKTGAHFIKAKVVDPTSAKKVEEQVLKGFSIGIKNPKVVKVAGDTKAPNGRIVGGQIIEVSLVDRPANENCKLQLAQKSADGSKVEPTEVFIEIDDETRKANYPNDPKLESCITKLFGDADMKKKYPDDATRKSHAIAICRAQFSKGVEDPELIKTATFAAIAMIEKADTTGKPPFVKKPDAKKPDGTAADDDETEPDEDDAKKKIAVAVLEKLADGKQHSVEYKNDEVFVDGEAVKPEAPASGPIDYEKLADMVAERVSKNTSTEATKALEERVAKVEKSAAGSGPVRMAGTGAVDETAKNKSALIEQAERYEKLAATCGDSNLADGYRELAKRERTAAATLTK